jgi:DNA mismatch repair protein MutL
MRLEAFLAPPERARSGAVALHVFVNGRPVSNRPLARAVAQGYGSVLEPGRYPVGVVYLQVPPSSVDVNVHPQKAEVRFTDARALYDALTRELYAALSKAFSIPALGPPTRPWLPPRATPAVSEPAHRYGAPVATPEPAPPPSPTLFDEGASFYARLSFLAQVRATFLLCEGPDAVYVIDQHAAAERVTFDRLRSAFASRGIATQRLLLPEIVELAPAEVAALEEATSDVEALGLEVRSVGASAVAVHAVPQILRRASPERLVRDVVAELARLAGRPFRGAADLVLATMACHGSIRAGDAVSAEEARALLAALDQVDFSGHCPHGRPLLTRMPFAELEHKVGRS